MNVLQRKIRIKISIEVYNDWKFNMKKNCLLNLVSTATQIRRSKSNIPRMGSNSYL